MVSYTSHVLSTPTEAVFRGANNEMTNTMMSHIHLYKKEKEKQGKGEYNGR